ncbi:MULTISPECIES: hydrolase [unclassified Acinetobacter]|uniref:alpha/beta hydrolase n=1 Tax=unclassified Acinetobacter TaxID=196816 RepID=UPI002934901F|nr:MULTISPECIES: hydrolase [unclassified Acinetobacter]WOE33067.1 hydrolase [Acinetobacter sp. SAAs470]WOE39896.1 hydrolase [Acinetobacter sp. SAAs474]
MSKQIFISGDAGKIEVLVDYPSQEIKGFAVVCHPHPLEGGTPQHKIPTLLAQTYLAHDCVVYRPSFRSSGQTEGHHDHGIGETEDILAVIAYARQQHQGLCFYAAGFSFGAHIIAKTHARLPAELQAKQMILCALPTATVADSRHYVTPAIQGDILLIHGEEDRITTLQDLIQWAKPQRHSITILPGANHFFTGYLKVLRITMSRFLSLHAD